MTNPEVTFPTVSLSGALGYLNEAISSVILPNIGYIIAAAAVVGAVTWLVRKGQRVVKLK